MLHVYVPQTGTVDRLELPAETPIPPTAIWLDLFEPTADERSRVEKVLGIQLPSREEMQEIEPSSRLYNEIDASYMTVTIMSQADTPFPKVEPFTFVLAQ